jgi:hypothetical protein
MTLNVVYRSAACAAISLFNYELIVEAKCSDKIIAEETKKYEAIQKNFCYQLEKAKYVTLFTNAVYVILLVSYGSVWYDGINFSALMRFVYSSPFQLTFNVLSR